MYRAVSFAIVILAIAGTVFVVVQFTQQPSLVVYHAPNVSSKKMQAYADVMREAGVSVDVHNGLPMDGCVAIMSEESDHLLISDRRSFTEENAIAAAVDIAVNNRRPTTLRNDCEIFNSAPRLSSCAFEGAEDVAVVGDGKTGLVFLSHLPDLAVRAALLEASLGSIAVSALGVNEDNLNFALNTIQEYDLDGDTGRELCMIFGFDYDRDPQTARFEIAVDGRMVQDFNVSGIENQGFQKDQLRTHLQRSTSALWHFLAWGERAI